MNQTLPKLPDLSANVGTIRTEEERIAIQYFPRSSSDARLREFMQVLPVYGELTGCTVDIASPEPAWTENPRSQLLPIISEVYTAEAGHAPRWKRCTAAWKQAISTHESQSRYRIGRPDDARPSTVPTNRSSSIR